MNELPEDSQCFLFRHGSSHSHLILKGPSFTVLVDQINIAVTPDHFYKLDDVEVILDFPQSLNLVTSQFSQLTDLYELV